MQSTLRHLPGLVQHMSDKATEHKSSLLIAGGCAAAVTLGALAWQRSSYKQKPSTFQLSGGSIDAKDVKREWKEYEASFGAVGTGEGIKDRSKVAQLVDVFYSLVTDIYEWGWGQSFHFSPRLPGKDWTASEAAHEARVAAKLGLAPGVRALDVGCGVGGPMRTIAAVSGAHVTGITINQYQVDRATYHNDALGLSPLTRVVRGDFLAMPFPDATFDAAYAIEATCHADSLAQVFTEIARVLKPGGLFLSYEWVSTPKFDPTNAEHVRIMDEIIFGNGLPEMRTWKQAEEAGAAAGFDLVESVDLAIAAPGVVGPWQGRLAELATTNRISQVVIDSLDALYLAPKGLRDVHNMLVNVARSLVAGGNTGVFTPMHMLIFKKRTGPTRSPSRSGSRK